MKLGLITDTDLLLIIENDIRGGLCHAIYQKAKANNKNVMYYDKYKESSYLTCWNVNDLYGCAMPQKFPVEGFKWVKNTSQFSKDFIKNNKEGSDKEYFLELDVQYPKKTYDINNDLTFFPERMKIGKVEKLVANLHDMK